MQTQTMPRALQDGMNRRCAILAVLLAGACASYGAETNGTPARANDTRADQPLPTGTAALELPEAYTVPVMPGNPPDPDLAASWQALAQADAAIVPAPKRFAAAGAPVPWSNNWTLLALEPGYEAGVELINRRLADLGAPPLAAGATGAAHRIVAGTFEALALHDGGRYAGILTNGTQPPRQGYRIELAGSETGMVVLVAGADQAGTRYGLVTISMLLRPGPELVRARVTDWPDFTYRMSYRISSLAAKALARNKHIIDAAFASKINLVFGGMINFDDLIGQPDLLAALRELNLYAAARNVRLVYGSYYNVGLAPFPEGQGHSIQRYPFQTEAGLMGHRGKAFSWSRDDLIDARGELLAGLMRETGISAFYLHSQDTGGRDNPENWNLRTPMDRERWGDDRAAADANLQGRFYRKLKEANPDVLLLSVAYPYGATYLQYPDMVAWLRRLGGLLPPEIYFCVREGTREATELWRSHVPQGLFVYHDPYPSSLRLMFTPAGRTAGTFYFTDRDIYWFCRGQDAGWPAIWVAAEYAWNIRAPGWGDWNASDYRRFPNVEAAPAEISGPLLSRITSILFGPAAAEEMRQVCLANPSCSLPANPRDYEGPPPIVFFKAKMDAAADAHQRLAAVEGRVAPSGNMLFGIIKAHVAQARCLLAARYYYYLAREHIAREQFAEALAANEQAKAVLAGAGNDADKALLGNDLDVTQSIEWRRERRRYVEQQDQRPVVLGVYRRGGSFDKGILQSLTMVPGMRVQSFDDPTAAELAQFDAIMFPGTSDMWDTKEDWRANIRQFVERGGGVIFSHNAVGRYGGSAFAEPLFPEICAGYAEQVVKQRHLRAATAHPAVGPLPAGQVFKHEYADHLTIRQGPQGVVVLVNRQDAPVMIVGEYGRGRVVYTGQIFGVTPLGRMDEAQGQEWRLLYHMVRWAGGVGAAARAESSGAD